MHVVSACGSGNKVTEFFAPEDNGVQLGLERVPACLRISEFFICDAHYLCELWVEQIGFGDERCVWALYTEQGGGHCSIARVSCHNQACVVCDDVSRIEVRPWVFLHECQQLVAHWRIGLFPCCRDGARLQFLQSGEG